MLSNAIFYLRRTMNIKAKEIQFILQDKRTRFIFYINKGERIYEIDIVNYSGFIQEGKLFILYMNKDERNTRIDIF